MKSRYLQLLRADKTVIVWAAAAQYASSAQQKTGPVFSTTLRNGQNPTGTAECNPSLNEKLCLEAMHHQGASGVLNHATVAACLLRLTVPYASREKFSVGLEARGILSAMWNRSAES